MMFCDQGVTIYDNNDRTYVQMGHFFTISKCGKLMRS